MGRVSTKVIGVFTVWLAVAMTLSIADAQQVERPLRPSPSQGLAVIPFMEGWYDNGDGSTTVSFGYHNRNKVNVVVPLGSENRIEPAQFDGLQPEIFFPGRHPGVFAIVIPASLGDETAWWHITSASEELSVPGERGSTAYELDRNPRPQGSVQPVIWFSDEKRGSGPEGVVASATKTVSVGAQLTLEVWTEDPSVRDASDPRFAKPLDTNVSWYMHQGPGVVSFTEHPSSPFTVKGGPPVLGLIPVAATRVSVPGGVGPARVVASFSQPGVYMIRARLDNWNASDSDGLDQCCWTNAYQRVRVVP